MCIHALFSGIIANLLVGLGVFLVGRRFLFFAFFVKSLPLLVGSSGVMQSTLKSTKESLKKTDVE